MAQVLRAPIRYVALAVLLCLCSTTSSQQMKEKRRTFFGPSDQDIPYPSQEGKPGERDFGAMEEIKAATASSIVAENSALDMKGTLTIGPKDNAQELAVSIAIETDLRFRLDIEKDSGTQTSRINGNIGQVKQGKNTPQALEDIAFVSPFSLPMLLPQIADRKDAAVVDDGVVQIGNQSLHKLTITLFQTRFGPDAACFYFDPRTHTLQKGAFLEHSVGNRTITYLTVVSYGEYRKEQDLLLPHWYSQTMDGQPVMTILVTSASIAARHDTSFFSF